MIEKDWRKCYGTGWGDLIIPAAYAHPAKFSRKLIKRIYEHALEQGYLAQGATVIDPFGGVALGGLHAMQNGLHWIGCELEEKFVGLGQQNIEMWNRRYSTLPRWGTAVLFQGDSRELGRVLGEAGGVVSSPPYTKSIARPSGIDMDKVESRYGPNCQALTTTGYGDTPGQLEELPEGNHAAVVSSPPYVKSRIRTDADFDDEKIEREKLLSNTLKRARWGSNAGDGQENYGKAEGQLGAMKPGDLEGVVSSPPWEKGACGGLKNFKDPEAFAAAMSANDGRGTRSATTPASRLAQMERDSSKVYGDSLGQLGNDQGETFWQAARQIMEQCYQVLAPGAVAIWVLKGFVRKKKYVDFPDQWRQLGEACGFESVEWIRAHLVEDRGAQWDLFGELHQRTVERKSFFRRLAEKNGSPRIDYEVVLVQRKPVLV